jgi:phosphatidate cytidylyltransferase
MAQDRDDSMRDETTPEDLRRRIDDTTEAVRIIGDDADEPPLRFAEDVTGELPHWTSPPTGEAPKLFSEASTDDLEAWSTFASQPVWRDDKADATMDDLSDLRAQLGGPVPREERTAAVRPVERGADDLFAGLEPIRDRGTTAGPEVEPEPATIAIGGNDPRARAAETGPVPRTASGPRRQATRIPATGEPDAFTATRGTGGRNMGQALGVGLAIAAVALVAFRMGPQVTLGLITVIVALCAVEFFTAVRESGHHHAATPVGLVAVAAAPVAAYLRGESGLVLVGALAVFGTIIWFMAADRRPGVVAGAGATLLGIGWIGILGGFAGLLLTFPNNTDHILAVALVVIAYDVVALLAGSSLGRTPMAPSISPNKTWEGTIVGVLVAILVSVGVTGTQLDPWEANWLHPLQLGVIGGVAAVLGDLASSVLKRDMGVKDWGTLLPGHGGALDRFSGFLFALPVAYYLCLLLNVY